MTRPITRRQIGLIKIRQKRLGMDDETYRAMLRERYGGLESCKDLSAAQAHDLIDYLFGGAKPRGRRRIARPAETPAAARPGSGNVVKLPSPLQTKLIGVLVNEVAWESADGYRRWLKRSLGLDAVRSAGDASRVIDGLKGLKRHGHAARP
ncbi:MAG: regulatory protein GemA [Chloroflexota bacterium]|nr:regulatory protein GemA [Chloroflexota bacterium]